jgi:hypothetical protein
VLYVRAILGSTRVKRALVNKFYVNPTSELVNSLALHVDEFEYVHCGPKRFQNIHVDIPPKYISMVFYIPEYSPTKHEQETNATIFYDDELKARNSAKYRPNSVGIFVPHYYSYHGFSSTTDRDVLVAFYINPVALDNWRATPNKGGPPFTALLDAVERKLIETPLIEYDQGSKSLQAHRRACLVNAPQGRVMRSNES